MPLGNQTRLSLSARWGDASGREFCMIPGLCVMYEVFIETFPEVLREQGNMLISFQGTLENILWEQN